MIAQVIWTLLILAVFSVNGFATSKVDAGSFVCVQPRGKNFFVVRGVLSQKERLDSLTIRRMESQTQGLSQKTLWENSSASISLDPSSKSISPYWKESSPYKVENLGQIGEATLFLPQELNATSGASVSRSRMKIRMKTGESLDIRLQCART